MTKRIDLAAFYFETTAATVFDLSISPDPAAQIEGVSSIPDASSQPSPDTAGDPSGGTEVALPARVTPQSSVSQGGAVIGLPSPTNTALVAGAAVLLSAPSSDNPQHPIAPQSSPQPAGMTQGIRLPPIAATAMSEADQAAPLTGGQSTIGVISHAAMMQPNQQITFTSGPTSVTGSTDGFYFTLPSVLYHYYGFNLSQSFGGFSISAYANIAAGIKGGVSLGLGNFSTNYPITVDPGAPTEIIDGTVFTVDPSLISVNEANFSLALLNASASLDLALQAALGATFSTPSVRIGVDVPFIGFVGFTIPSQSFSRSITEGDKYTLPTNDTVNIPGGSVTITDIPANTVTSSSQSGWGDLPTLDVSAETTPFLTGNVDMLALLADLLDLQGISDSFSEGPLSASYTLLSLPLSVSLSLGESVTLTPQGINVTATDLLNNETQTGPLGTLFTFDAPASGAGDGSVPVALAYTLDLAVHSAIGLDGTIALGIDGPQASISVLGIGGSIGPLFSANIFNIGGQIAPIGSWNSDQSLVQTTTIAVPNMAAGIAQTISTAGGSVTLDTTGAALDISSIGTISGTPTGIVGTATGAVLLSNAGLINAAYNGIDIIGGGSVRNLAGGQILSTGTAYGYGYGVRAHTSLANQVFNNGTISGFHTGIYAAGGFVTNDAEGIISAAPPSLGISIHAANARVVNAGTIATGSGIALAAGGSVYQPTTGLIDVSEVGIFAQGPLTLTNKGTIQSHLPAVSATGGTVTNMAGALLSASETSALYLTGTNATLINAGTIAGIAVAASLDAGSNRLVLAPTAVFSGNVDATGTDNGITLLAGTIAGTLTGFGTSYNGFSSITIASGATWTVTGALAAFSGVTLSGITSADVLDLTDTPFAAHETARVNPATDILTLYGPTIGSTIATLQLAGTLPIHEFTVASDGAGGTTLREPTTNPEIVVGTNAGILLNSKSYFGTAVSVAYTGSSGSPAIYGIDSQDKGATITNNGQAIGSQIGIFLRQGGTVVNGSDSHTYAQAASVIGNTVAGVDFGTYAGVVNNAWGIISGGAYGIAAGNGGTIRNATSSAITGTVAIDIAGAMGSVSNAGSIGATRLGIHLGGGGTVANDGTVASTVNAVEINDQPGMVINHGDIAGGSYGAASGVNLTAGGSVYNSGGDITGYQYGVRVVYGGTIDNFAGTISGIVLAGGGSIDNWAATITAGHEYGVGALVSASTGADSTVQLLNEVNGVIDGIHADNRTTITNEAGATIDGSGITVFASQSPVYSFNLINSGDITNTTASGTSATLGLISASAIISGINIDGPANITNTATGTIAAASDLSVASGYGILEFDLGGNTNLSNAGRITGVSDGVNLSNGAIVNLPGGTIDGGLNGVVFTGTSATVENAGTILGGLASVYLEGTGTNLLIVDAGATFGSEIIANPAASNTLALGAATGSGTLTGIGTIFTGFGSLDVQANASWTLMGSSALADGTQVSLEPGSTLAVSGTFSGRATFEVSGAAIVLPSHVAEGDTIDHPADGTPNRITLTGLQNAAGFAGTITNLRPTDRIVLPNVEFKETDHAAYDSFAGTLTVFDGITPVFTFSHVTVAPGAPTAFTVGADSVQEAACFAQGTRILTQRGNIPIEQLTTDDDVRTAEGSFARVQWLGYRRLDGRRHPRPWDVAPVRISADAFAPGQPAQPVMLSPDHAVGIDGVLIPIRYLLNGKTIRQLPAADITYWHVELAHHALILAEGLPCESYLDTGNRGAFENAGTPTALHPDFAARIWHDQACARLVHDGAELEAARSHLLERAELLGHPLTRDPAIRLLVNGHSCSVRVSDGWWRAPLPRGGAQLTLLSRQWRPAHTLPHATDTRTLGIAISQLRLDRRDVPLDHPALLSGWHAPEGGLRWTDGCATIDARGARDIAIHIAVTGTYWDDLAEPPIAAAR